MPRTNAMPDEHDPNAMSRRQILEAMVGLFTTLSSTTIIATALPTIIADLEGSQTAYVWVITPRSWPPLRRPPSGANSPICSTRRCSSSRRLSSSLSVSVVAGLAHSVPLLLTARVIQGVGMGDLTALAVAIIGSIVSPRERGRYSGYTGATTAVSLAGGPVLGGVIVDSPLGWRWCLFVCIPLAVIALLLLQKTLHISIVRNRDRRFDHLARPVLPNCSRLHADRRRRAVHAAGCWNAHRIGRVRTADQPLR